MLEDVCVRGTVTALLLLTSVINLSGRSDPGTCVCVGGGALWTYSGAASAAVLSCNKFIML